MDLSTDTNVPDVSLYIQSDNLTLDLSNVTLIGSIDIYSTLLTTLDLNSLVSSQSIVIRDNADLSDVILTNLTSAGSLSFSDNTVLAEIDAPNLTTVDGVIYMLNIRH